MDHNANCQIRISVVNSNEEKDFDMTQDENPIFDSQSMISKFIQLKEILKESVNIDTGRTSKQLSVKDSVISSTMNDEIPLEIESLDEDS